MSDLFCHCFIVLSIDGQLHGEALIFCSNAVKFTHQGVVGIRLFVAKAPYSGEGDHKSVETHRGSKEKGSSGQRYLEAPYENHHIFDEPRTLGKGGEAVSPAIVWLRCDVYDTGIGIPGSNTASILLSAHVCVVESFFIKKKRKVITFLVIFRH